MEAANDGTPLAQLGGAESSGEMAAFDDVPVNVGDSSTGKHDRPPTRRYGDRAPASAGVAQAGERPGTFGHRRRTDEGSNPFPLHHRLLCGSAVHDHASNRRFPALVIDLVHCHT
jgi:hypothetical protein